MSEYRTEIEKLLSQSKNNETVIANLSPTLKHYVMDIGLTHFRARMRARRRRDLLREIEPKFVPSKSGVEGRFDFSDGTKKRLKERSKKFFDTFPLTTKLMLGDATQADLISRVEAERKSGRGHELRAQFYEKLATPMKKGQRVRDVWNPENATKQYDELKKKITEVKAA